MNYALIVIEGEHYDAVIVRTLNSHFSNLVYDLIKNEVNIYVYFDKTMNFENRKLRLKKTKNIWFVKKIL